MIERIFSNTEKLEEFLSNLRDSVIAAVNAGCSCEVKEEPQFEPVMENGITVDHRYMGSTYTIRVRKLA